MSLLAPLVGALCISAEYTPEEASCVYSQTGSMVAASTIHFAQSHTVLRDGELVEEPVPNIIMQVNTMGSYEACTQVGGKYCVLRDWGNIRGTICAPLGCTSTMLKTIVTSNFTSEELALGWTALYCVGDDDSDVQPWEDDAGAKAVTSVLFLIAGMTLICTIICRIYEIKNPTSLAEGAVHTNAIDFCYCWDFGKNYFSLVRVTPRTNTSFLNGIKTIALLWTILGHTPIISPFLDNTGSIDWSRYHYIFMSSYFVNSNTFLFVCGFVVSYVTIKSWSTIPEEQGAVGTLKRIAMIYVDRYVRITPLYLCIIFFVYNVAEHVAEGPLQPLLYRGGGAVAYDCGDGSWVKNIFYITNSNHCYMGSWYLSVEFQCVLVGTLLTVLYKISPRSGYAVSLATLLGCTGLLGYFYSTVSTGSVQKGGDIYFQLYARCPSYLFGMLCAFVISSEDSQDKVEYLTAKQFVRVILYAVSLGMMWGVCSAMMTALKQQDDEEKSYSNVEKGMYGVFFQWGWGLGLTILTLTWACTEGRGGHVVNFLSHPFFEPLSRLWLGTYLIHFAVIGIVRSTNTSIGHYTGMFVINSWISVTVLSFFASAVGHVFIQRPFLAMWQMLSGMKEKTMHYGNEAANAANSATTVNTTMSLNGDDIKPSTRRQAYEELSEIRPITG